MFAHPFIEGAWILIEPEAQASIDQFRQLPDEATEAGGILIGYRRQEHLHVVEATTPMRRDRRSRFSFHRSDRKHAKIAVTRWAESEKKADYLGEWHTHPESHATPSSLDTNEWRDILARTSNSMIFWVAGILSDWVGLGQRDQLKRAVLCSDILTAEEEIRGDLGSVVLRGRRSAQEP
jgi:integrative and conjugative element protein (TIGR02256 family)